MREVSGEARSKHKGELGIEPESSATMGAQEFAAKHLP
jgi:hypothetical protein